MQTAHLHLPKRLQNLRRQTRVISKTPTRNIRALRAVRRFEIVILFRVRLRLDPIARKLNLPGLSANTVKLCHLRTKSYSNQNPSSKENATENRHASRTAP